MKGFYIILFVLTLASCQPSGKTIVAETGDFAGYEMQSLSNGIQLAVKRNSEGNITEQGFVTEGAKTGQWTQYDNDGKLVSSTNYIIGLKNGPEVKYDKRQQVESVTHYQNNELHGFLAKYKRGRVLEVIHYKNGQFDGPYRKYFDSNMGKGQLQQEIMFKNGVQHGSYRYFDEEGNVTIEYEYKNGEKVGGGIVEE